MLTWKVKFQWYLLLPLQFPILFNIHCPPVVDATERTGPCNKGRCGEQGWTGQRVKIAFVSTSQLLCFTNWFHNSSCTFAERRGLFYPGQWSEFRPIHASHIHVMCSPRNIDVHFTRGCRRYRRTHWNLHAKRVGKKTRNIRRWKKGEYEMLQHSRSPFHWLTWTSFC